MFYRKLKKSDKKKRSDSWPGRLNTRNSPSEWQKAPKDAKNTPHQVINQMTLYSINQ